MSSSEVEALSPIGEDIWVAKRDLPLLVGNLGARMTVIRLPSGGLFVHSPVLPDENTRAALVALAPVTAVVAPNKTHHFFIRRFREAFPSAEYWAAPGLRQKRADLQFDGVLTDNPPTTWAEDLDQIHIRGVPTLEEIVFYHRRSRTLILTDLAFNFRRNSAQDWRARIFLRLTGVDGRLGPHRLVRALVRDHEAFTASLRRMFDWDFETVVVSHGDVLHTGGKAALERAFARWLRRSA
ncbi:MAG: DUF4336 domain-containing protein [Candidatus Binatia bacterium]|nr:DUF4336 domain-containing protein [Candidatus Binatia bacterium]